LRAAALVLTASAVALAASANAAQPPHPPRPGPVRILRAVVFSGNGQSARAYVANGKKLYEAEFPVTLSVRVPGAPKRKEFFHVIFTCVSPDCTFAASDQPDAGDFLDRVKSGDEESENAYDVKIHNGVAALRVTVDSPALRTVIVRADPVVQHGERAVPAMFRLTLR